MPEGLTPAPANPAPFAIHIDRAADVIGWLPPKAADRLRTLRQHVDDLHLLMPVFEDRKTANEARFTAEQRLKRLQAPAGEGGFDLADDDRRVIDERRNVARCAAEAKRITAMYEARSAAWREAGACLSNVEAWLTGGRPPGTVLEDYEAPEPKLIKGESLPDVIERHRQHVRELKAELRRVQNAPLPSAYCKKKAAAQIEALAARGAPSVSHLIAHDRDVEFASVDKSVPVFGNKENPVAGIAGWTDPDALALFAWTFKDVLIKKLDAEIDAAAANDDSAMLPDARERATAEITVDVLQTERQECALTWRAMSERLPVEHRADVNPLALLSLSLRTATPDDAPGSSLDHALSFVGLR